MTVVCRALRVFPDGTGSAGANLLHDYIPLLQRSGVAPMQAVQNLCVNTDDLVEKLKGRGMSLSGPLELWDARHQRMP